jgi:hypothetical protein
LRKSSNSYLEGDKIRDSQLSDIRKLISEKKSKLKEHPDNKALKESLESLQELAHYMVKH